MATVKEIAPHALQPEHLRVAAYCRVSSDSEDQLHSYAAQIRSYTEEIAQHDGWELVDVYADEGLTGTRMDKREDFNRMMRDCRKGKIDRVLVKSVSRFARCGKSGLHQVKENVAMISYAPLWRTMKQRGVSTYALISQYGFSRGTLDRLKQTRNVTTNTLDDLCRILDCEIWDVIEYIPDTKKD